MGYGIAVKDVGEVELYRFGRSKQIFRGPKPELSEPYVSFVGGSEPFGKFVLEPFPKLVSILTGQPCVNFGTPGAGPGFFLKDPVVLEACSNSTVCVIQVMEAAPLSNRMYSVFPRRNMRLRRVSAALRSLYPQVDFTQFRFVSGMLRKLRSVDLEAYDVVLAEQRAAWLARMLELLEGIETRKILLWIRPNSNEIVTGEMVGVLEKHVSELIVIPVEKSNLSAANTNTGWMTKTVHSQVAEVVAGALRPAGMVRPAKLGEP